MCMEICDGDGSPSTCSSFVMIMTPTDDKSFLHKTYFMGTHEKCLCVGVGR